MKVLIISAEVWQDKTNGGNVLSNMFRNMDWEFAQIYCNPGIPENKICKKYYQMTDGMVIRNTISHKQIGKKFELQHEKENSRHENEQIELPNQRFYAFFHKHRLGIFYFVKHILWNISNWKNENLKNFIDEFAPDIIFAPCYGDQFLLRLVRFVGEYTGKKIISYISDDHYTLKQFSLSPVFWLERFILRYELRKTFPYYSLVYTMTETQKRQCEKELHGNMKILRKAAPYTKIQSKKKVNEPIRFVYAGGIYLNRWKTLKMLVDVLKVININGIKAVLDIYTGNEITREVNNALNDGVHSCIHNPVSQLELETIYQNSDIALHVESFDLKNRLLVRMSFSTKIVDCLSSGCAIMAICDSKQGGFQYLNSQNAAICVSNAEEIEHAIRQLIANKNLILEYAKNAKECCIRNHDVNKIEEMIKRDFEALVVS